MSTHGEEVDRRTGVAGHGERAMGAAVREHDARLDAVEARVGVLERRTG